MARVTEILAQMRRNMAIKNDRYTYRVTWSKKDSEYVGRCAEFPSRSWLAASPETALRGIRKMVADVIADLEANGEFVPEPMAVKRYSGKFMVRVLPELQRLALEAAKAGISPNRIASEKLGQ